MFEKAVERRLNNRIKRHVERNIQDIALQVEYEMAENQDVDLVRFNTGPSPRGISDEDFMNRVGIGAAKIATERSSLSSWEYDRQASLVITDEFEAIDATRPLPRQDRGLRIVLCRVFREMPSADES